MSAAAADAPADTLLAVQDVQAYYGLAHVLQGITLTVDSPTKLSVAGINKQQVGEVAATIRKLRRPDPYKGKGIRYAGEIIRRKVGKAGK